ncbi:hypothetical protein [Pantoea stewartii]|uniref:hypothetical protein n=1 Tax=Pantoea stewartii TaxID=66269 RepID=UPI003703FD2A
MSIPEKFYIRESSEQMKYLNYLFNFDELTPSSSGIHTFTLVPSEDGYFICGFGGLMCARYDSTQEKIVNLSLADKSKITDEDSALWLIDENSDGTVTIRNKKSRPGLDVIQGRIAFPQSCSGTCEIRRCKPVIAH